jgi:putative FmdB family regulatory protein
MPIYEYRCRGCGRKASLFFRSIGKVEADPACPHCGRHELARRMSRVWSGRSGDEVHQPSFEDDGVPFYGPDPFSDPYGEYDEFGGNGADGEDVAALAREARAMAESIGEPLDAEFDSALRHVEQGADPEDVFGELDAVESAREREPADGES